MIFLCKKENEFTKITAYKKFLADNNNYCKRKKIKECKNDEK